ncbi:hypothetical protein C5Y96_18780 [Blastopirellula marina]|uniref:Uncharacterized protein n=1 Tax=Blastopirellula marina TaxID=124 RepID=A0A2S8F6L2_9BACT|nr:hypothetical protein C5Y96_18780 [Blastopirellula marina]RCS48111.1 hypothetical protein DTL36_18805 [Bremerella cremea]
MYGLLAYFLWSVGSELSDAWRRKDSMSSTHPVTVMFLLLFADRQGSEIVVRNLKISYAERLIGVILFEA